MSSCCHFIVVLKGTHEVSLFSVIIIVYLIGYFFCFLFQLRLTCCLSTINHLMDEDNARTRVKTLEISFAKIIQVI